jgi:urease accessory protein
MTMHRKIALTLGLCLASSAALAHPGHAGGGLLAGFMHPFTGIDHLLAMFAVGLWAGQTGGAARWQLPAAFLAAMAAGWCAAWMGWRAPGIDSGIAASLLALGVALALRARLPRPLQLAATAAFAVLHGLAHGVELPGAVAAPGFLAATAALLLAGLGAAALLNRGHHGVYRAAGAGLALLGTGLLLQ